MKKMKQMRVKKDHDRLDEERAETGIQTRKLHAG